MRTKHLIFPLSILAVLVLTLGTACAGSGGSPAAVSEGDGTRNPGTSKRPRGTFTLASAVELAKGPWSGPSLTVNMPGHPLNGLIVEDISGNMPAGTELTVTSADVVSHSFSSRFKSILTPMITIEGTSQLRGPIRVRIPRPAGYSLDSDVVSVDPQENFLVYETLAGETPTFIDVVLYKVKLKGSSPKRGDQGGFVVADSSTTSRTVSLPGSRAAVESSSGFLPGIHDWPFVNFGSFAAPNGDCVGMSITAAYIYAATTGPTVRSDIRFTEDTPDFTTDDRDSRRLCGSVQVLLGYADALGLGAWYGDGKTTPLSPAKLIRNAKKRFDDGVPCVLALYSSLNNDGHAVATFAAGSNSLLIADPNLPGKIRELTADSTNSNWNPFSAQLNASSAPSSYDIFYLVDPLKFTDVIEPFYKDAIAGDVGTGFFKGVRGYTMEDYCSKKMFVRGEDNFILENPDLKLFPVSDYLIGLMDEKTGEVEPWKYYHRSPGGTFEPITFNDSKQMINLEKSVFDPEDEDCDFCTNMIPHRTKRPLDVDLRIPIYANVNGRNVWFDSINIKVKMKPMELDPAVAGGTLKP
jgi:hypothetical protein